MATREAADRLQESLERDLRERGAPIPFMRGGILYAKTVDGVVVAR